MRHEKTDVSGSRISIGHPIRCTRSPLLPLEAGEKMAEDAYLRGNGALPGEEKTWT